MAARDIYLQARLAGYSKEEAADAARNGALPDDPTAPYWDALLQQESGGHQGAVSPAGAIGIAQVMPGTAPEAAKLAGLDFNESAYRGDPDYNAAIGRAYLRKQMQEFGHPELGLAAYNAGPGRVRQYLAGQASLPTETQNYVPAITGNSQEQPMSPRERFIELRSQGIPKEQAAAQVRQEFQLNAQVPPNAGAQSQAAPAPQAQDAVPPTPAPQQAQVAPQGPAMGPGPQVAPAPQQAPAPQAAAPAPAASGAAPSLLAQLTKAPGLPAAQGAPQDVGDRAQAAIEDVAPIFSNPGQGLGKYFPTNMIVEATGGAQRGLADTLRGVRQAYNRLIGDEAKVNELNQQQDRSREFSKAQREKGTIASTVGEMIPSAAALIGPQAAASSLPGVAGTVLGSGTLQGLLGGAIQPTGTKDSALDNALLGAGLGAAGDVATGVVAALGKGRDLAKNKLLPDDALDDFSSRVLNSPRGGDVTPAYQNIGQKVADKADEVQRAMKEAYTKIEGANLPPVTLHPSADANVDFSLTDDLSKLLTPKTRRVLEQVNQSATRTSPIVDTAGRQFTQPQKTTFADVREAMREIKGEMRKLGKMPDREGSAQIRQLRNAMSILDDDLQGWAQSAGHEANSAYRAAMDLDKQYGKEVVPFFSSKSPISAVLKKPDEATIGKQLMGENTGLALQDLLQRVPETKGDLRQVLGAKLRTARGDVGATRALEGGTTSEALLSKPERDYLMEIAKTIREGKRSPSNAAMTAGAVSGAVIGGPGGAITGGYAGRLLDKALEQGQLYRLLHGVRKYGAPEYTPEAAPVVRRLTNSLRNAAIHKSTRSED